MRSRGKVTINAPITAAIAPLAPRQGSCELGSADHLRQHRHQAAREIEEKKTDVAHGVLHRRPKCPQINHVADDVHPAGVHEHRCEQRDRGGRG